jgi:hypothetical protein
MEFLLATIITCSQLNIILLRLNNSLDLTPKQKIEVVRELSAFVKTCPIVIKKG